MKNVNYLVIGVDMPQTLFKYHAFNVSHLSTTVNYLTISAYYISMAWLTFKSINKKYCKYTK